MHNLRQNNSEKIMLAGVTQSERNEVLKKVLSGSNKRAAHPVVKALRLEQIRQEYSAAKDTIFKDKVTYGLWKELYSEAKKKRKSLLPFEDEKIKEVNAQYEKAKLEFANKHQIDLDKLKIINQKYSKQIIKERGMKAFAPMSVINTSWARLTETRCFTAPYASILENSIAWYDGTDGRGGYYYVDVTPRNNAETGQFGAKIHSGISDFNSDFDLMNVVRYESWYDFNYVANRAGTLEVKAQIRILKATQSVWVEDVEWEWSDAGILQYCSLFMRMDNSEEEEDTDFILLSRIQKEYGDIDDEDRMRNTREGDRRSMQFVFHSSNAVSNNQEINVSLGARLLSYISHADDVEIAGDMNFKFRLENVCIRVV